MRNYLCGIFVFFALVGKGQNQTLSIPFISIGDSVISGQSVGVNFEIFLSSGSQSVVNQDIWVFYGRSIFDSVIKTDSLLLQNRTLPAGSSIQEQMVVNHEPAYYSPGNNNTVVIWPYMPEFNNDSLFHDVFVLGAQVISELSLGVRIYPIPAVEYIKVDAGESIRTITLLDMEGRTLRNADRKDLLSLAGVPYGAYFLRLLFDDGTIWHQKILIE